MGRRSICEGRSGPWTPKIVYAHAAPRGDRPLRIYPLKRSPLFSPRVLSSSRHSQQLPRPPSFSSQSHVHAFSVLLLARQQHAYSRRHRHDLRVVHRIHCHSFTPPTPPSSTRRRFLVSLPHRVTQYATDDCSCLLPCPDCRRASNSPRDKATKPAHSSPSSKRRSWHQPRSWQFSRTTARVEAGSALKNGFAASRDVRKPECACELW